MRIDPASLDMTDEEIINRCHDVAQFLGEPPADDKRVLVWMLESSSLASQYPGYEWTEDDKAMQDRLLEVLGKIQGG